MFLYRNAHQGRVHDMTQWVLLIQRLLDMYANFNGRRKHSKVGIFILMKMLKGLISSGYLKMLVFTRK
jgi:hypothetical protein